MKRRGFLRLPALGAVLGWFHVGEPEAKPIASWQRSEYPSEGELKRLRPRPVAVRNLTNRWR